MKQENQSQFFQNILKASPYRLAVIDRSGKFIYVNQVFTMSEEEVLKKSIWDFLPENDAENLKAILEQVYETGEQAHYINQAHNPILNKTSWYRNIMAPMALDGKLDYVVISFEETDEAKEKEKQLINKQAQLSAIINNTNDIILSIDKEYNIIEFNEGLKKLVTKGFGFELTQGVSVFDVIKFPAKEKLIAIYQKVFTGEKITLVDEFIGLNDKIMFFETSYNPIYTGDKISGISIFSRDITSDKEDEARLRFALKEKETLLSEIHHRVKNNLAAISSIIQLHSINTDNPEILELLNSAMNRLKTSALVHEMLYENDSLSNINFKEYAVRLCNYLKESFSDSTKNIQMDVIAENCIMNIQQAVPCGLILNELITNAFKHGYPDTKQGNIEVRFGKTGKNFRLSVINDGKRMPDQFSPFETSSIGMILVQTLTQQLDGTLGFESKPKTKFELTFKLELEE